MNNVTLYFDIETNGIEDFTTLSDLKQVHCLSVYNPQQKRMVTFDGKGIPEGLRCMDEAGYLCGHNVVGFDLPALKKLYNYTPKPRILDTAITSRVMHSDLRGMDMQRKDFPKEFWGSHSLNAWGHRMGGISKIAYEGNFERYDDDMKKYCERDVLVTYTLAQYLKALEPDVRMLSIEHGFAHVIRKQELRGFCFDEARAMSFISHLTQLRAEVKDKLQVMFPPRVEEMRTPKGWSLTLDGDVTIEAETKGKLKEMLKDMDMKQALVHQSVKLDNKTKAIPFNPGSRDQIAARLVDLGWEPTERTPDGRIKIDESVLKKINHPAAKLLLEYLTVSKRLGQVAEGENGWMRVVKKGRIHGKVNTNGAVTGRCTHSLPNLAQVPAVRATHGKTCRELFKAGDGYDLVGVDASGLELRCLAHYLAIYDRGAYAKNLIQDDIHTVNQKAAGLETRDQAKTFIYAFLYGAGDAKIGDIVGGSAKQGAVLKKRFLAQLPALARLKKGVEEKVKRGGFLTGIDGRILPIRSEHSALNMLLQSAGAVVMKQALIKLHRDLTILGWNHGREYAFVANVHDEFQAEVLPEKADLYGKMAVEAIRYAGDSLGFNCPLDGEYKVGRNWAETH
jgi:DNA polymerase I